jgi:hypothetical protein
MIGTIKKTCAGFDAFNQAFKERVETPRALRTTTTPMPDA